MMVSGDPKDHFKLFQAAEKDREGIARLECMQLRKQIDEMIKSGKLSQFIKELKQSDKPKAQKKGETAGKDKPLAILMIQPWERVAMRALRTPDIHRRRYVLRSSIRTLLRQTPARSKKPDDPSYHITHRIQWRNHLADRPDFPASKIGRRRSFHFRMDELHSYQVTIST
ncbi:hypothetical protein Tco_0409024 [Tanacetum coccineum]